MEPTANVGGLFNIFKSKQKKSYLCSGINVTLTYFSMLYVTFLLLGTLMCRCKRNVSHIAVYMRRPPPPPKNGARGDRPVLRTALNYARINAFLPN